MSLELVRAFFASLEAFDYAVLIINILLIIFARPILKRFSSGTIPEKTQSFRVNSLRGLNVFIVLVYGYQYFYRPSGGSGGAITLLSILAIFYVANLSNNLLQFFIHIVIGATSNLADLAKGPGIDNPGNTLPRIQLAACMLALDLLRAAHLFGKGLTLGEFFEFFLPGQLILPSC